MGQVPNRASSARWVLVLLAAGVAAPSIVCSAVAGDDLAARRSHIERLQPADQQELLRKQERFGELPLEEQDRLRALQAALDADANAEKLQQVLLRYHEWLKTLTPSQRAELALLQPKERVQQIKRIQRQQQAAREHAHRVELLSNQDMQTIVQWTEDLAWKLRDRLLANMPEPQRRTFDMGNEQRQRRILLYRALSIERGRRPKNGAPLFAIEQPDIDRLTAELSQPARQELAQAGALPAQRRVVIGWIGTAVHRLEPGRAARKLGPLAGEDLAQFLQNDVPLPQRERLLKMPREQMLEELRDMYFERGRGDIGLPVGPRPPWLDGKPPDRSKGEVRGKGGRSQDPINRPPESPSETPHRP
jgi:hypothetical protein